MERGTTAVGSLPIQADAALAEVLARRHAVLSRRIVPNYRRNEAADVHGGFHCDRFQLRGACGIVKKVGM